MPSSRVTSRSVTLSHLLPTSIKGTLSTSLTRNIWSRNRSIRSNVEREVIEYTSRKPSPSLMYSDVGKAQLFFFLLPFFTWSTDLAVQYIPLFVYCVKNQLSSLIASLFIYLDRQYQVLPGYMVDRQSQLAYGTSLQWLDHRSNFSVLIRITVSLYRFTDNITSGYRNAITQNAVHSSVTCLTCFVSRQGKAYPQNGSDKANGDHSWVRGWRWSNNPSDRLLPE